MEFPDIVMGKQLTLLGYEDWKRVRAMTSPLFSNKSLGRMKPSIDDCCRVIIKHLDERRYPEEF